MERVKIYCELHEEFAYLDGMCSWVPLEHLKEFLLQYYKDKKSIENLKTTEEMLKFISLHQKVLLSHHILSNGQQPYE